MPAIKADIWPQAYALPRVQPLHDRWMDAWARRGVVIIAGVVRSYVLLSAAGGRIN